MNARILLHSVAVVVALCVALRLAAWIVTPVLPPLLVLLAVASITYLVLPKRSRRSR